MKSILLFAGFGQHTPPLAPPCHRRALPAATRMHPQSRPLHRPALLPSQVCLGASWKRCGTCFRPRHGTAKRSRSQTPCVGLLQQRAPCGKGQGRCHGPPGAARAVPARPGHEGAHSNMALCACSPSTLPVCFSNLAVAAPWRSNRYRGGRRWSRSTATPSWRGARRSPRTWARTGTSSPGWRPPCASCPWLPLASRPARCTTSAARPPHLPVRATPSHVFMPESAARKLCCEINLHVPALYVTLHCGLRSHGVQRNTPGGDEGDTRRSLARRPPEPMMVSMLGRSPGILHALALIVQQPLCEACGTLLESVACVACLSVCSWFSDDVLRETAFCRTGVAYTDGVSVGLCAHVHLACPGMDREARARPHHWGMVR